MKYAIYLETQTEVEDFVRNLWKSDAFRDSHINGGIIADIAKRFAYLPRIFAHTSNDYLERPHFSTWWNVIMLREYDNPIINDLYYLHEMTHAASMPYVEEIGSAAFRETMQRNELEASVLSEIAIYFDLPELRKCSFQHEIYADRFLHNPRMQNLYKVNRETALETLRSMRLDVMVSKPKEQMDMTEIWIRRFADQNVVYASVWADRYREVERGMSCFQRIALGYGSNPRKAALEMLRRWLDREIARDPKDNIPFRQEAELFAPFYWSNKEKYEDAMK